MGGVSRAQRAGGIFATGRATAGIDADAIDVVRADGHGPLRGLPYIEAAQGCDHDGNFSAPGWLVVCQRQFSFGRLDTAASRSARKIERFAGRRPAGRCESPTLYCPTGHQFTGPRAGSMSDAQRPAARYRRARCRPVRGPAHTRGRRRLTTSAPQAAPALTASCVAQNGSTMSSRGQPAVSAARSMTLRFRPLSMCVATNQPPGSFSCWTRKPPSLG